MASLTRWVILLVLFFSFVTIAPVWGTMVLPLSLSQMTEDAERIFVGRCLEEEIDLDEYGIPSTFVRLEVKQGVKGVDEGERLLIKVFGISKRELIVNEGESVIVPPKMLTVAPTRFKPNTDYLLFLYPESDLGFTSAVGAGQGQFEILKGVDGASLVVNPLGNRFLGGLRSKVGPQDLGGIIEEIEGSLR